MCFIYAIYNPKHKKIYIGQTLDLNERLLLHNNHTFKGYTSRFDGEWQLIYSEKVDTRQQALIKEKQLKSYRGREFIKQHIRE
jgi:putative endonuclease